MAKKIWSTCQLIKENAGFPKPLHVLFIPSWYRTDDNPINGHIFFDDAKFFTHFGLKTGIIYCEMLSLKKFSIKAIQSHRFQYAIKNDSGVLEIKLKCWNLFPKVDRMRLKFWIYLYTQLFEKYVSINGYPDVLHAHSLLFAGIVASCLSKKYQIPYHITEHCSYFFQHTKNGYNGISAWKNTLIYDAYKDAQSKRFVSQIIKEKVACYFKEKQTGVVIPNMFDTKCFTVCDKKKDHFIFITLAFHNKIKRLDTLIKAFFILKKRVSKIKLIIGGEGPETNALKKLTHELNLQNDIEFAGPVKKENVVEFMQSANSFVLPSLYETFGMVAVEALLCGLPVIASKTAGVTEFLEPSCGEFFESDTAFELSSAMEKIMDKPYCPNSLHQLAKDTFDFKRIVPMHLKEYNKCQTS